MNTPCSVLRARYVHGVNFDADVDVDTEAEVLMGVDLGARGIIGRL